jgi:hypothetical protein
MKRGGFMGTQQRRQGHDGQDSRQQSQQGDGRPQQERDLQRDKQSDRGQQRQQGAEPGRDQQHAGDPGSLEGEGRRQDQQNVYGNVYGEGNYAASRQYNEATKNFAQSGRAEPAARAAAPRSESEAREMADAEAEGKRHAKGEDPALNRRSRTPQSPAPRPGKEDE